MLSEIIPLLTVISALRAAGRNSGHFWQAKPQPTGVGGGAGSRRTQEPGCQAARLTLQLGRRSTDYRSEVLLPKRRLQTTNAMAAHTHKPTPAIAHGTSTYPKVPISATQANTDKILIGHLSEATLHRGESRLSPDPATVTRLAQVTPRPPD